MFRNQELVHEMPRLRKFASRLCRSPEEADDLTQATALRALEKREMFHEDGNLFSWTSKMMYNLFVSDYRRRVKFETQYDPEPYLDKQNMPPRQQRIAELKATGAAMKQLSDEHRTALILVCVKDLSYKRAAEILDVPVGTVRSRLARAREQLEALMDG